MTISWPPRWQPEAIAALTPFLGGDSRLRIIVDPPTAIFGTLLEGYVYVDDQVPTVIYDRSGRPDVYPWRLSAGPVLRIYELRPRRKKAVVFAHPDWSPRDGGA